MIIHNVRDRRGDGWIGSWTVEPLIYAELGPHHVGRTVIYKPVAGDPEAGTLVSWRDGLVFARYSQGDAAAGANFTDLYLAVPE
jgi:hypothetical protein